MKELQAVVDAAREAERSGKAAVLATVVKVQGSAYRRPGARMLVTEEGWRAGSVSGGCLESDVVERAWRLTEAGPAVVSYDTTDDDDIVFGVGLGCRGVIHVLFERLARPKDTRPDLIGFFEACLRRRERGVVATVLGGEGPIGAEAGGRLLLHPDGGVIDDLADAGLREMVQEDARDALASRRSESRVYVLATGRAEVFIEVVEPPVPLVVFGAGHDAIPVVRLAKELGWHVTVVDGRPAYATSARFPEADDLVVSLPDAARERVRVGDETVALVMTHNYLHDLKLLKALLPSPARYLGVLGSRSRTRRLLQDLKDQGATWTDEHLHKLYAPVGLDIGADTPEGIALAVVAEIQAVLADRPGGLLRERKGPIHRSGAAGPEADDGQPGGEFGGQSREKARAVCGLSAW